MGPQMRSTATAAAAARSGVASGVDLAPEAQFDGPELGRKRLAGGEREKGKFAFERSQLKSNSTCHLFELTPPNGSPAGSQVNNLPSL